MSIQLTLDVIPAKITKEEWYRVYEETLILIDKYSFLDRIKLKKYGESFWCCIKTKEDADRNGCTGWFASGDFAGRKVGEEFYFPKELGYYKEDGKEQGEDVFLAMLLRQMRFADIKRKMPRLQRIWGESTMGEPYHLFLLAVGCLVEARLPGAAVVGGCITLGQCKRAVRWANQYLDMPIELSDRAYSENLYKRIQKMKLSEVEQLEAFLILSQESRDEKMGEFIEGNFQKAAIDRYLVKEFPYYRLKAQLQSQDSDSKEMPEIRFIYDGEELIDEEAVTMGFPDKEVGGGLEKNAEYDVTASEELMEYRSGDIVAPSIDAKLKKYVCFLKRVGKEDYFKYFMTKDKKSRIKFMLANSGRFLMDKAFWREIMSRIMDDEYMKKYYPMARVKADKQNSFEVYYALFSNKDLMNDYYKD